MSEQSQTRVSFRKQVSDGNYGSETAEVTLEVVDPALAQMTLALARRLVHEELARSPSGNVRREVEAQKPPPDEDLEGLPL